MYKLAAFIATLILFIGCLGSGVSSQSSKAEDVPEQRDQAQFIQNPFQVTDSFIEEGRAIYEREGLCVGCHGLEGEEPFYHSIKHHADRHTYGDYLWIVTYGLENTPMPPFNQTLTLEERWKVVTYLKKRLAWGLGEGEAGSSLTSLELSIYELDKLFGEGSDLTEDERKDVWAKYSGKKVTWKGQVTYIQADNGLLRVGVRHMPKPRAGDYDVLLEFSKSNKEGIPEITRGEYVTYTGVLKAVAGKDSPYVLEGVAIEGAKITSD